jgi:hypothetical protein
MISIEISNPPNRYIYNQNIVEYIKQINIFVEVINRSTTRARVYIIYIYYMY